MAKLTRSNKNPGGRRVNKAAKLTIRAPKRSRRERQQIQARLKQQMAPLTVSWEYRPVEKFISKTANTCTYSGEEMITPSMYRFNGTDSAWTKISDAQTVILPVNPNYWIGTRVAVIAHLYQKFQVLHAELKYVPTCAATTAGSLSMGSGSGPICDASSSATTLTDQMLSQTDGGKVGNLWSTHTCCPTVTRKIYEGDGDVLTDDGYPSAIYAKKTTTAENTGFWVVKYSFHFTQRRPNETQTWGEGMPSSMLLNNTILVNLYGFAGATRGAIDTGTNIEARSNSSGAPEYVTNNDVVTPSNNAVAYMVYHSY